MHMQFLKREDYTTHRKYEDELKRLAPIKNGDVKGLKEQLAAQWPNVISGTLSDDPIKNAKYLFICNITVVARVAVETGVELETAYGLSDLYIQTVDKCSSVDEIAVTRREMLIHYTQLVANLKKQNVYSKPIIQSLDYIYDNLHNIIRVDEIANSIGLSPSYFSTLFKKELGTSVSEYIRRKRIEAAENMLRYSDFTLIEISQYLAFASYSHFADIFRNYTGITPKEYRKRFYRKRNVADI